VKHIPVTTVPAARYLRRTAKNLSTGDPGQAARMRTDPFSLACHTQACASTGMTATYEQTPPASMAVSPALIRTREVAR
jgi:hypothetical protein